MTDVKLNVVGQWFWGSSLNECNETFVTKFHEENRYEVVCWDHHNRAMVDIARIGTG